MVGVLDLAALFHALTPQIVHPQEVAPAVTGSQDLTGARDQSTPTAVLNQAFSTFSYFETVMPIDSCPYGPLWDQCLSFWPAFSCIIFVLWKGGCLNISPFSQRFAVSGCNFLSLILH